MAIKTINGIDIDITGPISVVTIDDKNYEIKDEAARNMITEIEQGGNTAVLSAVVNALYPAGSVYFSNSATKPFNDIAPNMEWELIAKGCAIVGVNPGSSDSNMNAPDKTFGTANSVVVAHTHGFSATSGGPSSNSTSSAGSHYHGSANGSSYKFISHNASNIEAENSKNLADGTVEFPRIPERYAYGSALHTASAGAHTHTLNNHTHSISGTTGGASGGVSGANQNYQPSYTVYIWQRTS